MDELLRLARLQIAPPNCRSAKRPFRVTLGHQYNYPCKKIGRRQIAYVLVENQTGFVNQTLNPISGLIDLMDEGQRLFVD